MSVTYGTIEEFNQAVVTFVKAGVLFDAKSITLTITFNGGF